VHQALLGSLSASHLLDVLGVAGVLLILFAETGLLIGFFLPGDSLLFVGGYATVAHNALGFHLPLGWLIIAAAAGSIIGSEVGWAFGRAAGGRALARGGGRLFKPEYVERTRIFFERFGPVRAVALARLVPIVRTVMNPLAGVAGMGVRSFTVANVASGIVWTAGLILLGHGLGQVDVLRKHIDLFAILVVLLSLIPLVWHLVQSRRRSSPAR
jgi:membrane-associated protein